MGRLSTWRTALSDRVSVWRDIDSERWCWGVYVWRSGVTIYVMRRCYRASWWRG
jgi:hypothetical protein